MELPQLIKAPGEGNAEGGAASSSNSGHSSTRNAAHTDIEVDSTNVIQLIEQFLKENGLNRTLATLQEESQVSVNTVDNMELFVGNIQKGEWDVVLQNISTLKLPQSKLMDLYEHIILELIEMREMMTARAMLRQTLPMTLMKQQQPERLLRLEHMIARSTFVAAGTSSSRLLPAIILLNI